MPGAKVRKKVRDCTIKFFTFAPGAPSSR